MTAVGQPEIRNAAFDEMYGADALSALMRSTWTWDDRALRRDLAALLVDLAAARASRDSAMAETLLARGLHTGAQFSASVLGPKLIADTGNPLRRNYLEAAADPAEFARRAAQSLRSATAATDSYIAEHITGVPYAPQSRWRELVAAEGTTGLAEAMRAYGHSLCDSAFFATFGLAWQMLTAITRSELAGDYARQLVAGELTATLAAAEQTGSWDPVLVKTRATTSENGWRLDGVKQFVPAADTADLIMVIGRSVAGPSVFAVHRSAPGVKVRALAVLDPTRPLFEVSFQDAPARLLGREGAGGRVMFEALGRATTALAGEQIGLVERAITSAAGGHGSSREPELVELALQHTRATALWREALAAPTPENNAMAHIAASAAAMTAAATVAARTETSPDDDVVLRRAISGNLLFGGPALSHERLLERIGI